MREEAVSEIPPSGEGELPLRNLKFFLGKGRSLRRTERLSLSVSFSVFVGRSLIVFPEQLVEINRIVDAHRGGDRRYGIVCFFELFLG